MFLAGPVAQERWIVENHIAGEDWRDHSRALLAAVRGAPLRRARRIDDWLGALERMLEQDPPLAEIVDAGLREAYIAAGEELRGAMIVAGIGARHPPARRNADWAERELRVLLGEYRDQHVRRGPAPQRAENAELLLNFLESLGPRAELHRLPRRDRRASSGGTRRARRRARRARHGRAR